jgi:hypothetical protein
MTVLVPSGAKDHPSVTSSLPKRLQVKSCSRYSNGEIVALNGALASVLAMMFFVSF